MTAQRNVPISIQARTAGQDAAGQPVDSWVEVAKPWANVAGQSGLGSITAPRDGVVASTDAYSMRIPYREDLDASMRVVYRGRNFDIKQIRYDLSKRNHVDLIVQLGGSDG